LWVQNPLGAHVIYQKEKCGAPLITPMNMNKLKENGRKNKLERERDQGTKILGFPTLTIMRKASDTPFGKNFEMSLKENFLFDIVCNTYP
jgi:hypothetical protein